MDVNREYQLCEVCMLIGVQESVLRSWMSIGIVSPIRRGGKRGMGRRMAFDARTLLGAGLIKSLRRAGAGMEYIAPLAKFIARHTPAELAREAEADRLLIYAGAALPPRFVDEGEEVKVVPGVGTLAFQVSMKELWTKVQAGILHLDRQNAAQMEPVAAE